MKAELDELRRSALAEIAQAVSQDDIERLRARYVGRKGLVKDLTNRIPSLAEVERREAGRLINQLKTEIAELLSAAAAKIGHGQPARKREPFDITLPGTRPALGAIHPISRAMSEIRDIFATLGFEVALGPEVELERYNFDGLNIPSDHPARDSFDTFYLENGALLRSHTSPVQVRVMEQRKPPIRIIVSGKVYRPETVDASHSFAFNQVEGLMVDEGVSFADLKYVLAQFARAYFCSDVRMRFRPDFFPFTEPSAEVAISCFVCGGKGKGCGMCKSTGWIEILGSGMVHPNVLKYAGYDTEKYTGFAFGMGVERLAMLKLGISDIRLFLENDIRFLSQFRGVM